MKKNKFRSILSILFLTLLSVACNVQKPKGNAIIELSRIENIRIDGNTEEWSDIVNYRLWADPLGKYSEPSDLETNMKLAWDKEGLALLFEVVDDRFISDTLNPWNGDAIEIFLAPFRGSEEIIQFSLVPLGEKNFVLKGGRSMPDSTSIFNGKIESFTSISGPKRITELKIAFNNYRGIIKPGDNFPSKFAMQVYVDDADQDKIDKNLVVWYPVGQSYNSSFSMFEVKLSEKGSSKTGGSSRLVITDNDILKLYVFGGISGDEINIYRNGEIINKLFSSSSATYLPDTIDLSSFNLNTENDTIRISLNGDFLCPHELFLAPRLYEKLSEKKFEREIRNFLLKDRQSFPPPNGVLFIGSSSIVRWETLKKDFPELKVIHRGFGGSNSAEALMYVKQIALPYLPASIVYYEGDNDIPQGLSADEICSNVKAFVDTVSSVLPNTKIFILSPKPSILRMQYWDRYILVQKSMRKLSDQYENVIYVDVSSPMFHRNGKLNHSLFVQDGIHMNQEGYAIWTNVLRQAMGL